jgi:DNA repair protein RadC
MTTPSTYVSDLRDALAGQPRERIMVVGLSPFGRTRPILIAEGDEVHASYNRRALITAVEAHRCKRFVVGHGHPVNGQIYPSHGDLLECWQLGSVAALYQLKIEDFIIVSFDNQVLSFAARGILEDPLEAGKPFAREGLRLAARLGH